VIYRLAVGPERLTSTDKGYQLDFKVDSEPYVITMPVRNLIREMDSIERSNICREAPFWFDDN
jgi:hypothetical protein